MKNILALTLLLAAICANAQTDSIQTTTNQLVTGSVIKNYTDRLVIRDSKGREFMVLKDDINKFNIRSRVFINGIAGFEYISDINTLNKGNLPEFKDQQHYLKNAGALGIGSAVFIVGGAVITGIGQAIVNRNNSPFDNPTGTSMVTVGSVLSSIGTVCLIPTFVYVFKAGKVKNYRYL